MRRLPPLAALRTFEAVGRLTTIREAADELNVTPAAVSHQLRILQHIPAPKCSCAPARESCSTKTGLEFHEIISDAFDSIAEGAWKIAGERGRTTITLNSVPSFASCWLVPHLSRFYLENPDIQVEITSVGNPAQHLDFAGLGAQLAIRVGLSGDALAGPGPTEKLVHEEMFPVCAPSLLQALREPRDIAEHNLLLVSRRAEGWPEWFAAAECQAQGAGDIDASQGLKFDTIQLALTAAIEGMGIAMGRTPLVDRYLTTGQLVEPFGHSRAQQTGLLARLPAQHRRRGAAAAVSRLDLPGARCRRRQQGDGDTDTGTDVRPASPVPILPVRA